MNYETCIGRGVYVYFKCRGSGLLQGHLRSTCDLPPSSYSCLEIHICWKDPNEANIEPPIQAPNLRSPDPLALMIFSLMLCFKKEIRNIKNRKFKW